jgi:hypothetical protein
MCKAFKLSWGNKLEQHRAKKPTYKKDIIILRVHCYVPNLNNPKPTQNIGFNYQHQVRLGSLGLAYQKRELFVGGGVL